MCMMSLMIDYMQNAVDDDDQDVTCEVGVNFGILSKLEKGGKMFYWIEKIK